MAWRQWAPYVSVAERRRRAKRKMESLRKRGVNIQPVEIEGRNIATTFWGRAWCDHLEGFSDFENRLPRGRTYVRNGSVCHLAIAKGRVEAKVSGSTIYNLRIRIKTLKPRTWNAVKRRCAGKIGSLLELLQGNLSDHVMEVVTDRKDGLFPQSGEITFDCDCPDWAVMCKHVAAVLYGVGARLDEKPELLFALRGVNHQELIDTDAEAAVGAATRRGKSKRLAAEELSDVFGIEIQDDHAADADKPSQHAPGKRGEKKARPATGRRKKGTAEKTPMKKTRQAARKSAKKKSPKKKTAGKKPSKKKALGKASGAKTSVKKKAAAKRPSRNTSAGKKAPSKKTARKKSTKKAASSRKPRKGPAKKTPSKKTATTAGKAVGGKRASKKTAQRRPPASPSPRGT